MNSMLILGGTGIIGSATADEAIKHGYSVTVTGKEDNPNINARFIRGKNIHVLENELFDVVFDIYTFDTNHAKETYLRFNGKCGHIFILSTTLVYDRSGFSYKPIATNHPLAEKGTQGGYVDHKLEAEEFWKKTSGMNWTILRPYHVLGKGSYLGCLPPHNRDPYLIDRIWRRKIELCDGGRVPLNVVHPKDIGETVITAAGNPKTFRKAYNSVNPTEVMARDYYLKIAELLGTTLTVGNLPAEAVWSYGDWKLTTLPHIYDTRDLERDIGYVPSTSFEICIQDALRNQPRRVTRNETEIYKRMHIEPQPLRHRYF